MKCKELNKRNPRGAGSKPKFHDKKINDKIFKSVEGNTNSAGSREGDGVYVKYRSFRATYSINRWID